LDPVKCHRSAPLAARLILEHDRVVTNIPGKMDALRVAMFRHGDIEGELITLQLPVLDFCCHIRRDVNRAGH
jgi:hypothetical protein